MRKNIKFNYTSKSLSLYWCPLSSQGVYERLSASIEAFSFSYFRGNFLALFYIKITSDSYDIVGLGSGWYGGFLFSILWKVY